MNFAKLRTAFSASRPTVHDILYYAVCTWRPWCPPLQTWTCSG